MFVVLKSIIIYWLHCYDELEGVSVNGPEALVNRRIFRYNFLNTYRSSL